MEGSENTAQWYVVHTYSGYENKVATNLQLMVENLKLHDLIQDVRVPVEKVTEITEDNKKREVDRKIFPGYVLVKMVMNNDTWYIVRNTRGCTGFVGPESKPIPLTEEEVAKLGMETAPETELPYTVGSQVKVVDGTLQGYAGVVTGINTEKGVAQISINMFGRETPAEIELDKIVSID